MVDRLQSVQDVQECVRAAAAEGKALAPQGGGTQLHVGYPPSRPVSPLSLSGLSRLVEYTPEDLVVVAQVGMTLAALQAILSEHRQWLPIEVAQPSQQTLGGIVASRANSLVRGGYGSVRDWLIGLQVVDAKGEVVQGGGKVVKNVSGYDLPKLYCGSWGTLGAITQVAFKVAALPPASVVLLAVLGAERNSEEVLDKLLAQMTPTFTVLANGQAASHVLGDRAAGEQPCLAVRLDGAQEAVDELADQAAATLAPLCQSVLLLPDPMAGSLCEALRDFPLLDAPLVAQFHILSSQVGAYVRMVEWTAERAGLSARVVADALAGIVFAQFWPPAGDSEFDWLSFYPELADKAGRVGGSFIIERMPDSLRAAGVPVWSPELPDWKIMADIKNALDPQGLFNPGRFVGRI